MSSRCYHGKWGVTIGVWAGGGGGWGAAAPPQLLGNSVFWAAAVIFSFLGQQQWWEGGGGSDDVMRTMSKGGGGCLWMSKSGGVFQYFPEGEWRHADNVQRGCVLVNVFTPPPFRKSCIRACYLCKILGNQPLCPPNQSVPIRLWVLPWRYHGYCNIGTLYSYTDIYIVEETCLVPSCWCGNMCLLTSVWADDFQQTRDADFRVRRATESGDRPKSTHHSITK